MPTLPLTLRALALGALALVLAGCGGGLSSRKNPAPCPRAYALHEASRIVEFRGPEAFENVAFTGEIQTVRSLCTYRKKGVIEADLELDIGFGRGPAATEEGKVYRYWVAVTRKDLAVLDKQFFDLKVRFERDRRILYARENVERIVIPQANKEVSGANFEILVGFDLTAEQIEFNRLGKRFTVDAVRDQP